MDNNAQTQIETLNHVLASCLCANARKAARMITKMYDDMLQPSGLLVTQFIILGAVGAQTSIALTPLADQLGMDPTTLARNLKPLEREGWIEISKGTDRRTRIVALTHQGTNRLMQAYPYWEQAHNHLIQHLGAERSQTMLMDWSKLVAIIGA